MINKLNRAGIISSYVRLAKEPGILIHLNVRISKSVDDRGNTAKGLIEVLCLRNTEGKPSSEFFQTQDVWIYKYK